MERTFRLAKPYGLAKYGLANQQLCNIQIYKILEKKTRNVLEIGWRIWNQVYMYTTASQIELSLFEHSSALHGKKIN